MTPGDYPPAPITFPVDFIHHQPLGQPPIYTPVLPPALTCAAHARDLADKDRRIQELLESNNAYLERARKAEAELARMEGAESFGERYELRWYPRSMRHGEAQ